jgi:hypothetical protein
MTYLDFDGLQKPKLYFRISDGQVKDVQKNLTTVVHTEYADQYQSIRDSIQNLFQTDIGIVLTDALDKATKTELHAGNYAVLKNDSLGFTAAIKELMACLPAGRSACGWKHSVPQIIEQINQNEKITIDKLDIVGQTGKLEILEWINGLTIPAEPEVDGTQVSYDKNVEPLKALKKNLLTQFTRKFKAISETIKGVHRQKLTERLTEPILGAVAKCIEKAELRLKPLVYMAQVDQEFPVISTIVSSMTHIPVGFFDGYFTNFRNLKRACEDVYEPVKTKYLVWLEQQESLIMKVVEECKAIEAEDSANICALCSTTLEEFQVSRLKQISAMYTFGGKALAFINPAVLCMAFSDETKKIVQEQIMGLVRVQKIEAKITSKSISVRLTPNADNIMMNNDLAKPIYDKFCQDLDANAAFLSAVTERKIALLDGFAFSKAFSEAIADVPCIYVKNFDVYVTKSAYDKTYAVLYEKVFQTMLDKGYVTKRDRLQLITLTDGIANMGQHARPHIVELFKHTFNKTMARGFCIPSAITNTAFRKLMDLMEESVESGKLDVSGYDLTSLPPLHDSLKRLVCMRNQLTSLPPLPNSLTELVCENNQLSVLPPLPDSLTELSCDDNCLVSLPTLPGLLEYLSCAGNLLTSLPSLPDSLAELSCGGNMLNALPSLPCLLKELNCCDNKLTVLPLAPSSLIGFEYTGNPIANAHASA